MTDRKTPVLHLLAGINGAGKTTFYYQQIKRPNLSFINADEIQKQRWPDETNNPQRSYEAAKIAAEQRAEHIRNGKSFVAETVFSHPSKLKLISEAQENGFNVALYHIHVATPELAQKRVSNRAQTGGHDVPGDKIKERFPRTLAYLQDAVKMANRTMVFDNSDYKRSHRHLMTLERGVIRTLKPDLPDWAYEQYGAQIEAYQSQLSDKVSTPEKPVRESQREKAGLHHEKAEAFRKLSAKELLEKYPDDEAIQNATVANTVAGKFSEKFIHDSETRNRFLESVRDKIADNLEHGREITRLQIFEDYTQGNDDPER